MMSSANPVAGAISAGIGAAIEKIVLTGLGIAVGGGILLEGAALSGFRALKDNQTTAAKVAKCILAVIAMVGAIAASAGLGFSAALAVGVISGGALTTEVFFILGALVAAGTMPLHWKAFQWSGLINT